MENTTRIQVKRKMQEAKTKRTLDYSDYRKELEKIEILTQRNPDLYNEYTLVNLYYELAKAYAVEAYTNPENIDVLVYKAQIIKNMEIMKEHTRFKNEIDRLTAQAYLFWGDSEIEYNKEEYQEKLKLRKESKDTKKRAIDCINKEEIEYSFMIAESIYIRLNAIEDREKLSLVYNRFSYLYETCNKFSLLNPNNVDLKKQNMEIINFYKRSIEIKRRLFKSKFTTVEEKLRLARRIEHSVNSALKIINSIQDFEDLDYYIKVISTINTFYKDISSDEENNKELVLNLNMTRHK